MFRVLLIILMSVFMSTALKSPPIMCSEPGRLLSIEKNLCEIHYCQGGISIDITKHPSVSAIVLL